MLKINLDKEYRIDTITAKAIKKLLKFKKKNDILQAQSQAKGVDNSEELLDAIVDFIVDVYNNQFTTDTVWENLPLSELQGTLDKTAEVIMNVFNGDKKK